MLDAQQLWKRYQKTRCNCPGLGITVDPSRIDLSADYLGQMREPMAQAFTAMAGLEAGDIANPDENRMVGHYWLRDPQLAPTDDIAEQIRSTIERTKGFAKKVHDKAIVPPHAPRFTDVLLVGIGGSALGPQLVADALASKRDKLNPHFLDNTDPDGISRTLTGLRSRLKSTLVLVVSKSGGTPETRNGMEETRAAFAAAGLDFAKQAVAITGKGSKLQQIAQQQGWLDDFPMWDWVGGRTSITSAVGLVPMALQGIDIDAFLQGAREVDTLTRSERDPMKNPASLLALCWHCTTAGRGERDMVILPYKDRLLLLSRYLQQLVMESLGKETDLDGNTVHQGIAVYGNKGSTDQHAYVQQLREGLDNFFANFIVVRQDVARPGSTNQLEVEDLTTSGDYLNGFWLGTRQALYEKGRPSVTIFLDKLDTKALGAMIALYERTVGFYATLVNINAYHQPGVEAGKKAAATVLPLQTRAIEYLRSHPDKTFAAEDLAAHLQEPEHAETLYHVLEHLAANKRYVKRVRTQYRYLPPKKR